MQSNLFTHLFPRRVSDAQSNAQPKQSAPSELEPSVLTEIAGGLSPNGTWAPSTTTTTDSPNGTW